MTGGTRFPTIDEREHAANLRVDDVVGGGCGVVVGKALGVGLRERSEDGVAVGSTHPARLPPGAAVTRRI